MDPILTKKAEFPSSLCVPEQTSILAGVCIGDRDGVCEDTTVLLEWGGSAQRFMNAVWRSMLISFLPRPLCLHPQHKGNIHWKMHKWIFLSQALIFILSLAAKTKRMDEIRPEHTENGQCIGRSKGSRSCGCVLKWEAINMNSIDNYLKVIRSHQ